MIKETLKRIQNRIEGSASIPDGTRSELLSLLEKLESEIGDEIPGGTGAERLHSALGLTEVSALESAREDKPAKSQVKEQTIGALQAAIEELEVSHPKIASTISQISNLLSGMGI